jgi:hypothetical protein
MQIGESREEGPSIRRAATEWRPESRLSERFVVIPRLLGCKRCPLQRRELGHRHPGQAPGLTSRSALPHKARPSS